MSYWSFLLIFLVVPIAGLLIAQRERLTATTLAQIIAVCLLALIYTTPWDHWLIAMDVWNYGEGKVSGTIWLIPVEEYTFFILQSTLTSLFTIWLLRRWRWNR